MKFDGIMVDMRLFPPKLTCSREAMLTMYSGIGPLKKQAYKFREVRDVEFQNQLGAMVVLK